MCVSTLGHKSLLSARTSVCCSCFPHSWHSDGNKAGSQCGFDLTASETEQFFMFIGHLVSSFLKNCSSPSLYAVGNLSLQILVSYIFVSCFLIKIFNRLFCVCCCLCLCLHTNARGMSTGRNGHCAWTRTAVGFACLLPCEFLGSTQVVRLGGERCYLLSHPAGPSLILVRHFINPQHDPVCLFMVD